MQAEVTEATTWWRERAGPSFVRLTNDNPVMNGMSLLCTPDEWRAFIDGVKNGEFDLDEHDLLPAKLGA